MSGLFEMFDKFDNRIPQYIKIEEFNERTYWIKLFMSDGKVDVSESVTVVEMLWLLSRVSVIPRLLPDTQYVLEMNRQAFSFLMWVGIHPEVIKQSLVMAENMPITLKNDILP